MSTRRKFVTALNVIAVCIASLSYVVHRISIAQTPVVISSVEMQHVPIPTIAAPHHPGCGPSCVITSRSVLIP